MKRLIVVMLMLVATGEMALHAATVSDVTAQQRYPWNGLVDINFTVSNVVAGKNKLTIQFQDVAGGTNLVASSLTKGGVPVTNGVTSVANGGNTVLWDAQRDLPGDLLFDCVKASVTVDPYTFSVKFNANGGTGTMANETFNYGTAKALTANAFTRSGYTFSGWSKTATGSVAYTNRQSVSNLSGTDAATVNLYAVWKVSGGVQLWANGPYWAECNVGATKPEESGYYFWWGGTVGYRRNAKNNGWVSVKTGASFSFSDGNCPTLYKSNSALQSAGYIDSTGNLVAAHDAATAHLGAPWRMPTKAEFQALIDNCTTTWTKRNGVYGRLVTGKGAYASKSIFLPAAGYGTVSSLNGLGSFGDYWSSTPSSDTSYRAWFLYFYSGDFCRYGHDRYWGQSVRPLRGFAQ